MMKNNLVYGKVLASISTILLIILAIANAKQILDPKFFFIFIVLGGVVTLLYWIIVFLESKQVTSDVFSFNESSRDLTIGKLNLSKWPLWLKLTALGGGLGVFFSLGAIELGSQIITVPQPFNQAYLSIASSSAKIFFQSVIPGFFEESAMMIVAYSIFYILRSGLSVKKKLGIIIITVFIAAGILTWGHSYAYGANQSAYFSIFFFESFMQFFNILSGGFVSWIPHIMHNAVVSLNFLTAFSIGGFVAPILFFSKRRVKNG